MFLLYWWQIANINTDSCFVADDVELLQRQKNLKVPLSTRSETGERVEKLSLCEQ